MIIVRQLLIASSIVTLFTANIINATDEKQVFYIRSVATEQKVVALTFDDGPHPRYTRRILRTLQKHGAPAHFFLLGQNIKRYPKIAKLITKQGHGIGNHSYRHQNYNTLWNHEITEDIRLSQRTFHTVFGQFPTYVRPPYGNLKKQAVPTLSKYFKAGIKWNIDLMDWAPYMTSDEMIKNLESNLRPGSIILLHDTLALTNKTLPKIIETIHKNGYTIVSLEKLLSLGDAKEALLR